LAKSAPKLVEDLVPKTLPLGVVVKVLQNLLQERVPIRDMRSIVETLAEYGLRSQDPDILTSVVRAALGRLIVHEISGMQEELPVITLDHDLEQLLHKSLQTAGESGVGIEPGLAEQMHTSLQDSMQKMEMEGQTAVLLVSSYIRPWLARFVRHSIPGLHVLAYNEIPADRQIKVVQLSDDEHSTRGYNHEIKRFFAEDIRQAMKMVKEELGADAVIMSNRSVDGGVEIVAARDFDEQLIQSKVQNQSSEQKAPARDAKKPICLILKRKKTVCMY
jgi:Flagellar biosynthesis pathway, component FlhA